MYNTIVYNQRPYNSPVDNTGYKTLKFLRGVYLTSFIKTEKILSFIRNEFTIEFDRLTKVLIFIRGVFKTKFTDF